MKEDKEIQVRAKVLWEGGLKSMSIIRGFEVECDQPKVNFGTNTAPGPLEVFTASMGACFLSSFVWAAFRAAATIEDCNVSAKASSEEQDGAKRVKAAEMELTIWAKEEFKAKLETCFKAAKKTCILTNSVSFPLEIVFKFKEAK